ncbi:hypothetical protein SRHO_G00242010 [Serrasalmus rhombeus]
MKRPLARQWTQTQECAFIEQFGPENTDLPENQPRSSHSATEWLPMEIRAFL